MNLAPTPASGERTSDLPPGVVRHALDTHPDERGDFTEIFRQHWHDSPPPIQWNLGRSRPNVLRGVHVHVNHWDYLCVTDGTMTVGLHDLREAGAAATSALLQLSGDRLEMLVIPTGVAHGFYSPGRSTYVIGASGYYDPADHRRCRWDCPELGLAWPCDRPALSPSDRDAPGYAELVEAYRAAARAP
jgi:dTDP-4-dehydrorhamnose 3,5-epimerase